LSHFDGVVKPESEVKFYTVYKAVEGDVLIKGLFSYSFLDKNFFLDFNSDYFMFYFKENIPHLVFSKF